MGTSVSCRVPSDWIADISLCWFEWQSIVGGLLAVVAALIGAGLLNLQIQQTEKHKQDEIARRHIAARLTMPLALSGISELSQKIADSISSELETYGPDGFARTFEALMDGSPLRKHFNPIALPPDVLGAFEKFVETLTEAEDIKHVSELIGQIQILLARFNGFKLDGVGARTGLESLLLDVAVVRLLTDRMFNYARNVDSGSFGIVGVLDNKEAWAQIRAAAQGLVFARRSPDHFFPAIDGLVNGYIERDTSPWLEKFSA